jgi:deazaflavin-dependent oxidoreductase (nitroreductase family)
VLVSAPQRVSFGVRTASALIGRLLALGVPLGPLVLLTVRGRASGQPRTTPVALLEREDQRWLVATFGEVNWTRNLRAAGEATLGRGRRRERVVARQLAPEAAGSVLHAALAPHAAAWMIAVVLRRLLGVAPDAPLDTLIDRARRHPVFELRGRTEAA